MRRLLPQLIAVLGVFAGAGYVHSQTVTGTVGGTVNDASGAVVPGAQVAVTQDQTGLVRTAVTGESGNYAIPLLPVGSYSVRVTASGFRETTQTNVQLSADLRVEINFALTLGDTSERVEITAAAPLVGTSDATMGQVVETKRIEELPLNGRNFAQLIQLTSGVTAGRPGEVAGNTVIENFRGTFTFNTNGLRSASNNYLIDGVDNNEGLFNAGGVVIQPVVDAIQEFKVSTTNMPAEFGRTAGGVVSIQTKAGSNQFHGVLFEFSAMMLSTRMPSLPTPREALSRLCTRIITEEPSAARCCGTAHFSLSTTRDIE